NEINSYTIIPPVISRCHISDEPINLYPGRNTLDLYSLKNSTLHSLGLNYELNNTLGFSHIYVINLINRRDRREKLEILAKKLNLKFEFFPAVSQDDENALKELEDDVDFELNIASIISDTYRFLPSNWDIYFLGY
ncbi:11021_t:CDS:2, partial [Racocetra persica]